MVADKTIISIVIILVLSVIGVAGDFLIKLSGNGARYIDTKLFVLGLLIYGSTAFGWFYVMKNIKLSSLGVFYSLSTALFLVLLGVLYFKEKLNMYEISGAILAVFSLLLLSKSS